jgi:hypothetical protein
MRVPDVGAFLAATLVGGGDARAFLVDDSGRVLANTVGASYEVYPVARTNGTVLPGCFLNNATVGCLFNMTTHAEYAILQAAQAVLPWRLLFVSSASGNNNNSNTNSTSNTSSRGGGGSGGSSTAGISGAELSFGGVEYRVFAARLRLRYALVQFAFYNFVPFDFFMGNVRRARDIAIGVSVALAVAVALVGYLLLQLAVHQLEGLSLRMERDPWQATIAADSSADADDDDDSCHQLFGDFEEVEALRAEFVRFRALIDSVRGFLNASSGAASITRSQQPVDAAAVGASSSSTSLSTVSHSTSVDATVDPDRSAGRRQQLCAADATARSATLKKRKTVSFDASVVERLSNVNGDSSSEFAGAGAGAVAVSPTSSDDDSDAKLGGRASAQLNPRHVVGSVQDFCVISLRFVGLLFPLRSKLCARPPPPPPSSGDDAAEQDAWRRAQLACASNARRACFSPRSPSASLRRSAVPNFAPDHLDDDAAQTKHFALAESAARIANGLLTASAVMLVEFFGDSMLCCFRMRSILVRSPMLLRFLQAATKLSAITSQVRAIVDASSTTPNASVTISGNTKTSAAPNDSSGSQLPALAHGAHSTDDVSCIVGLRVGVYGGRVRALTGNIGVASGRPVSCMGPAVENAILLSGAAQRHAQQVTALAKSKVRSSKSGSRNGSAVRAAAATAATATAAAKATPEAHAENADSPTSSPPPPPSHREIEITRSISIAAPESLFPSLSFDCLVKSLQPVRLRIDESALHHRLDAVGVTASSSSLGSRSKDDDDDEDDDDADGDNANRGRAVAHISSSSSRSVRSRYALEQIVAVIYVGRPGRHLADAKDEEEDREAHKRIEHHHHRDEGATVTMTTAQVVGTNREKR